MADVINAAKNSSAELTTEEIAKNTELYHQCLADMAIRLHQVPDGIKAAAEGAAICNEATYLDTGLPIPRVPPEHQK